MDPILEETLLKNIKNTRKQMRALRKSKDSADYHERRLEIFRKMRVAHDKWIEYALAAGYTYGEEG